MKKYNNAQFANRLKFPTVMDWYPSDSLERFSKLSQEHQDYWNSLPPIKYYLNKYNFRSPEFPEVETRDSITFLGCSQTFGIGLHKDKTWASLVAEHFNLPEINLSVPGGSLDSAFRVYNEWQPIHKSKITCLLLPPDNRFESRDYTNEKDVYKWQNMGWWSVEPERKNISDDAKEFILHMLSPEIQEVRVDRNMAAIKYIAQQNESRLIILPWTTVAGNSYDFARDNSHGGFKWNRAMADDYIGKINEYI
jgi:hypothetical protein